MEKIKKIKKNIYRLKLYSFYSTTKTISSKFPFEPKLNAKSQLSNKSDATYFYSYIK